MKKITICLLALLMVFTLTSCGGGDDTVPAGYQLASNSDVCDYLLYVPDTWITESGTPTNFTEATVAPGDKCNVSLMPVEAVYAETVADYWAEQQAEYERLFGAITVSEEGGEVTLGSGEKKVSGYRYVFTAKYGEGETATDYKFMQIFFLKHNAVSGSSLYVFTYTATADHYDSHLEAVNGILTNFSFK